MAELAVTGGKHNRIELRKVVLQASAERFNLKKDCQIQLYRGETRMLDRESSAIPARAHYVVALV